MHRMMLGWKNWSLICALQRTEEDAKIIAVALLKIFHSSPWIYGKRRGNSSSKRRRGRGRGISGKGGCCSHNDNTQAHPGCDSFI